MPVPGPEHPDWPWVGPGGPPSTMSDRQHRRWRRRSQQLRVALTRELGRAPTGRESIERCDRPAALEVLGLAETPVIRRARTGTPRRARRATGLPDHRGDTMDRT